MFTTAAVSIGDSVQQGLDKLFAFLPNLVGALVILVVGYFIARIIRTIVSRLSMRAGVDRALRSGKAGSFMAKATEDVSPSKILGAVAFWFLFLGTLSLAAAALQIPELTSLLAAIYAYLPNVIAAVAIFLIAGAVAAFVGGLIKRTMGDSPTGKIAGTAAPVVIMAIAVFMILNQLQIAPEIVTITYAALLGSAALGLALAFGLGGRETAARMVEDAYEKRQAAAGSEPTGRFARQAETSSPSASAGSHVASQ